ncbi:unnamed protein product, partial [Schistosoma margrebowiei]
KPFISLQVLTNKSVSSVEQRPLQAKRIRSGFSCSR